ncbi:competence protein CoiA family protein [Streptomyces sp. NPDC049949]|uniref:competence protein CoiA family protein n=1 Tax=Streptomyces sp. NPDC049949 TaxID=3154627 RepID=UPI003436F72A
MPLTASSADYGTLDATLEGLGHDLPWEMVYRARPRPALVCSACGFPMHAKTSARGARFFAHDRRSPHCPSRGESEPHRTLKRALADAARAAGHHVSVEAVAAHGGWRADVLAAGPDGHLTALEAQVSSASLDDVLQRTRRYQADGADVVWFTPSRTCWLGQVPSVLLQRPDRPDLPWRDTLETVTQFSAGPCECDPRPFWHNGVHAAWTHPAGQPISEFVDHVLHGRLVPDSRLVPYPRLHRWATPKDIQAARDHQSSRS